MKRFVIAVLSVLAITLLASATPSPIGPGSNSAIGPSTNVSGNPPPPSSCPGTLDLSKGCAQLVKFGVLF